MSTSELSDLEAVLDQVLPDPRAYAERVVQQLLDRLAVTAPDGSAAGGPPIGDQALLDRNAMLAAALGACECWGEDPRCAVCSGDGAAGWSSPDPALYAAYVRPARRPRPPTTDRASARPAPDLDEVPAQNGEADD